MLWLNYVIKMDQYVIINCGVVNEIQLDQRNLIEIQYIKAQGM